MDLTLNKPDDTGSDLDRPDDTGPDLTRVHPDTKMLAGPSGFVTLQTCKYLSTNFSSK